jgi:aquaporin Z
MDTGEHSETPRPEAGSGAPRAQRIEAEARGMWRALLALESPATLDFDNPTLEWRRLFSEILGTFLLLLAGAGAGVVDATTGGISRTAAVAAPGLTVMAIILFMGACPVPT